MSARHHDDVADDVLIIVYLTTRIGRTHRIAACETLEGVFGAELAVLAYHVA